MIERNPHRPPSAPHVETVRDDETCFAGRRLLSPSEAAAYLGLGSRFAIYRLVASGRLPAVRLANKIRLDLRDLDVTIEQAKHDVAPVIAPVTRRVTSMAVPRELAPRQPRRPSVTTSVTETSSNQ
jgi:excisionase family DNA binding protein